MKICRVCKKQLDLLNFYKVGGKYNGHRATCKKCHNSSRKNYNEKNKEQKKEYDRQRYLKNKDKIIQQVKDNYDPEKKAEYDKQYRENNRGKVRFRQKKYKKAIKRAMPNWLTEGYIKQMQEIYHNCPEGYHVDHIIPIQGKNVCGLHVPWNLQYLPARENICKSNKILVQYYRN